MTDQNDNKPISTFDEICHLTIEAMRKMDLETLMQLQRQAVRELDRARLTKDCIALAMSLKKQDDAAAEADANQLNLFKD